MRSFQHVILALCAVFITAMPAAAQNLVDVRILAERGQVQAGESIWIGIEQSIAPHWHTYWKNSGDSGTETRAAWDLPDGFTISDIHWPIPKKIPYGPLLNYGYEDNVVLLQKLKIPNTISAGPFTLNVDIELLVCKDECIPEYGTYALSLNGPQSETEDNTAYFKKALTHLPQKTDWSVFFSETTADSIGDFVLTTALDASTLADIRPESVAYFPDDWGILHNAAPLKTSIKDGQLTLTQTRGERPLDAFSTLTGVLSYKTKDGDQKGLSIKALKSGDLLDAIETPQEGENATTPLSDEITILNALILALLGGMILNLMPCVFPVLSIKALSLVKMADEHPGLARMHGISYTAGVVISFVAIAAVLLGLKGAGAEIGWGFQLQNPIIVGALAYLLFLIGLNLSGFFDLSIKWTNTGDDLCRTQGLPGSFFTGILATLVAAPCTAPFMAAAIGFALTQTTVINLTIFAALGFGLALPYLLLSFIPALRNILPKPGAWMERFKEFLAFPMFLSAIWLVWVISQQAGPGGVLQITLGMVFITFGIWVLKYLPQAKIWRKILQILAILTFLASAAFLSLHRDNTHAMDGDYTAHNFGNPFSMAALEDSLTKDHPIFVEMTAAWCITCKVNHASSIDIPQTRDLFAAQNVEFLIGDWTNQDPVITKYLNSFGRNGVPIYVYYGPRNPASNTRPDPQILPQILSPDIIKQLFEKGT